MLTIHYNATNGQVVGDAEVLTYASNIVDAYRRDELTEDVIGSAMLVYAFRLLVARGVIDCSDIQFSFNSEIIPINSSAIVQKYPKGFCDSESNMLRELVLFQISENKKKREARESENVNG